MGVFTGVYDSYGMSSQQDGGKIWETRARVKPHQDMHGNARLGWLTRYPENPPADGKMPRFTTCLERCAGRLSLFHCSHLGGQEIESPPGADFRNGSKL